MKCESKTTEQDMQDRILRVDVVAENPYDNAILASVSDVKAITDSVASTAKTDEKIMSEVEFEELVCDVWTQKIENEIQDYRKKHQTEPTDFKKASWMAREILKRVGFKIER